MTVLPARTSCAKLLATAAVVAVTATGLVSAGAPASSAAVRSAAVSATGTVSVLGATLALTGTDTARPTNGLVVYTAASGATTGTNKWGTEVAVVKGRITAIEDHRGNMAIPAGGYVVSGHGTASAWLAAAAKIGGTVSRTGPSLPVPTPAPTPSSGDAYLKALSGVPGLTHYYPLDATSGARDLVGGVDGSVKGSGVSFSATGATFTGKGYVELPDNDDFSVATKGGMTVLVDLTVTDWHGAGASEYVHWMGKGVAGAHEWSFRHYVQGGTGEAPARQGRVSFYHFNPAGGLGAGSYVQDPMSTTEHVIEATADLKQIQLAKDGVVRDTDLLSGYSIVPKNTTTPVRIGSRGDGTGFLVGKIRRVAFFDRVLTAAETSRLATAAKQ
jgi:hypothetical protein